MRAICVNKVYVCISGKIPKEFNNVTFTEDYLSFMYFLCTKIFKVIGCFLKYFKLHLKVLRLFGNTGRVSKKTHHYGPNLCTHRKIKAKSIYAKYFMVFFFF